jgi:cation transport ATPase
MLGLSKDVIMYILLVLFGIFIFQAENRELKGCEVYTIFNSECDPSKSIFNFGMIPKAVDSTKEIKDKMMKAATIDTRVVKWRLTMVLAIIISFLTYLLIMTPGSLPPWNQLYITVLLCFTAIYMYFSFMSFHGSKDSIRNIKVGCDLLISRIR